MIGYKKFGELRLSDFLIGQMRAEPVSNWEFLNHKWTGEIIGFTQWLCLENDPHILRCISLDLVALPARVSTAILDALELNVHRGMSMKQATSILGKPTKQKMIAGRKTCYFHTGGKEPFEISCTFDGAEGLIYVSVTHGLDASSP